jgi:uncharacterized oxidoreductase
MRSEVLDVQDRASLGNFVSEMTEKYPALNVLINNAGIGKTEDLNA